MNCYNGEKYLADSIESIVNQKYKNWELVFWDNHSKDNSKKIFKSFSDKRLKYFKSPKHTTLYEARNKAIAKAKGKYIAFCDTDDMWKKNKLELQIKFMKRKRADFSFTAYEIINSDMLKKYKREAKSKLNYESLIRSCDIGLSTVMMKKKLFNS